MSVIDPQKTADYIIKGTKIREVLMECELSGDFIEAVNRKVIQMLQQADYRRIKNGRKRIYPNDL